MTPTEFVEIAPLYTQYPIKGFASPPSITRMCLRPGCKRETSWIKSAEKGFTLDGSPQISFSAVTYSCVLCAKNSLCVLYQNLQWSVDKGGATWSHKAVRKIGQVPAQEIEIPAALNERLGDTAGHYKKALISRNNGYGIGALAYLRRVVDEKTDELIDVMAELASTYTVSKDEIAALLKAKEEFRYETKLEKAAPLIPSALRPGGVNPLGQLYGLASMGLHGKSDEECITIFDDLRADFEYVFLNLHFQAEERTAFAKRMQSRAGRTRPGLGSIEDVITNSGDQTKEDGAEG
jgi:hypothetical protein